MNNLLLLEDTRQVERKHELKHNYFRSVGVHWNRTALYCGDYTLPADQSICIDTKKDIQELIGDIQVRAMPKRDVYAKVFSLFEEYHLDFDFAEEIYHAICDDDTDRFAEKEINDICFSNHVPERAIAEFQTLYVKRHGFFHRGLKRAQNSGIRLIVLVENRDGVTDIESLFRWHNPRSDMWINSGEIIGRWKNGKPRYRKVQKFKNATTGEQLAKACMTMQERYGCEFRFTTPENAGMEILNLLGMMQ